MQKGVLIINMSRGSLIDEQDLIEALDSGQVGGLPWMSWKMRQDF